MAKPELKFIVIACANEQEAKTLLGQIIDEHEIGWPSLAYNDGFGRLIQAKEDEGDRESR